MLCIVVFMMHFIFKISKDKFFISIHFQFILLMNLVNDFVNFVKFFIHRLIMFITFRKSRIFENFIDLKYFIIFAIRSFRIRTNSFTK